MGSTFQTIVLVVFGGAIVIAVLIFSGVLPGYQAARGTVDVPVTMWGSLPSRQLANFVNNLNDSSRGRFRLTYVEKPALNYEQELIEALASGNGPDIFVLTPDLILKHGNKLTMIPYETISEREFRDTYIQGAEIFLGKTGVMALPVLVDPLVMYYNRDILARQGIPEPPKVWAELLLPKNTAINKVDDRGVVSQSLVAFGRYQNVSRAKEILAMMLLQVGNPLVDLDDLGRPVSVINRSTGFVVAPAQAIVDYYLQFADPAKDVYSWNSSLPESQSAFAGGTLALYFGQASEAARIQQLNPNLNFDVALPPQRDLTSPAITSGSIIGLAISAKSENAQIAFDVARSVASTERAQALSAALALPPARRDLLAKDPTDPFLSLYYRAALISRAWLDPDYEETNRIFGDMIQRAGSGRAQTVTALTEAKNQMDIILERYQNI